MPNKNNLIGKGFDNYPERINKKGRPRKYVSVLKDSGYKLSEINDTIQNMMAMNMDELKNVFDDAQSTILEKTIATAMVKSLKKGSLYSIDTLLNRVYGKPKEQIQQNSDSKIEVVFVKGKTIL
jgi:tRNA A37 N6-isopentenylltransferase MiaA